MQRTPQRPRPNPIAYFRGGVLLLLGLFIVFFSEPWFTLAPWQQYGVGGILTVYGVLRVWSAYRSNVK